MNERDPSSLIRSQLRDLLSAPSAEDIRDEVRRLVEANRHLRDSER